MPKGLIKAIALSALITCVGWSGPICLTEEEKRFVITTQGDHSPEWTRDGNALVV